MIIGMGKRTCKRVSEVKQENAFTTRKNGTRRRAINILMYVIPCDLRIAVKES